MFSISLCVSVLVVKNAACYKISSVPGNPRTLYVKMSSVPRKEHCSLSEEQGSLTDTAAQYTNVNRATREKLKHTLMISLSSQKFHQVDILYARILLRI